MKNLLLAISVTIMLVGTLCAGTNPLPLANSAQTSLISESSSLVNLYGLADIRTGNLYDFDTGNASPMLVCQPGQNCNNDQMAITIVL